MNNPMSSDVSSLGKSLPARFKGIWTLSSVPSFVRLQISKLGESLTTGRFLAKEWLVTSMCTHVNLKVGFLEEEF